MSGVTKRASVSVIIPTYNAGHLVPQAIESVLAQTVAASEILVVDDGSTDDTRSRLTPYRDRVRYLQQENRGVAEARNLGIRHAEGDFVAFLDADDIWHPRKLELQLGAFERHPELGLLGTALFDWPAPAPPVLDAGLDVAPVLLPWRDLAVKNHLATSSVLARRSVLDAAGPFDRELRGPEDHDLWLRVAEVAAVARLDQPLTGYRTVPGSLSQHAATMEAGMRRILAKLDERGAWRGRPLLRQKAASYLDFSMSYILSNAGDHGTALARMLRSMAAYPIPYRRDEVRTVMARPKLLLMLLARRVGVARSRAGATGRCLSEGPT